VPSEELAKMAKGVAYSIQPVNAAADYKWKVKEGLTITREASATTRLSSLEAKLDAVLQRLDKLEKRVEKLESDKRKEGR
jgi:ubiquinone biosynthesis protein UbiJ